MATQTGNTYISGTAIDSIEILAANMGFLMSGDFEESVPNDCHNDRQPEVAIWPPKPEILIHLKLCVIKQ